MKTIQRQGYDLPFLSPQEFEEMVTKNEFKEQQIVIIDCGLSRIVFAVRIGEKMIKSPMIEWKEDEIITEEKEELEKMQMMINTGWQRPDPAEGEFECVYCGALAHSPRVVYFPCPCLGTNPNRS